MKIILKSAELSSTLVKLFAESFNIDVAVAWASAENDVFKSLLSNLKSVRRAIIGTHFYQTHPDVLDILRRKKNVRFVLQPSGVFHPKVYTFESDERWSALVGSANLTSGAFGQNSEIMLYVDSMNEKIHDVRKELAEQIDQYWAMGKSLTEEEALAYRQVWARQQKALRQLKGEYGKSHPKKSPVESKIMSMNWAAYYKKVQADQLHGFEERCGLLQIVRNAFATHKKFAAMERPLRKTIAGLPNDLDPRWGWFGSMQGVGYFHQAVNNNDPHLSKALDKIPLKGLVRRQDYLKYINEYLKAFPNGRDGVATASRLLALKRPDQFVCIDKNNRRGLCKDFGIARTGIDYDDYWDDIIERIMDTPWWNVERPAEKMAASVWDGRAAMLDAIFYEV